MQGKKTEPWRIIIGIISIAFIMYMYSEKDILPTYSTMPKEQVAPLILTTILVTFIKAASITGIILLIKWIIKKFTKRMD